MGLTTESQRAASLGASPLYLWQETPITLPCSSTQPAPDDQKEHLLRQERAETDASEELREPLESLRIPHPLRDAHHEDFQRPRVHVAFHRLLAAGHVVVETD